MKPHFAPHLAACAAALFMLGLQACSPTYNWRETQPPDAGVLALFPCKPDRFSRALTLAGAKVQMLLVSCSAGTATFALSHADLPDAALVPAALQALREAATRNVGGTGKVVAAMKVPGMTLNTLAERLQIDGLRPDGGTLRVQAGFFSSGTRVYQASVVGTTLDPEAVDTFFAGLRLPQ